MAYTAEQFRRFKDKVDIVINELRVMEQNKPDTLFFDFSFDGMIDQLNEKINYLGIVMFSEEEV